jgi:hypothetical protein
MITYVIQRGVKLARYLFGHEEMSHHSSRLRKNNLELHWTDVFLL